MTTMYADSTATLDERIRRDPAAFRALSGDRPTGALHGGAGSHGGPVPGRKEPPAVTAGSATHASPGAPPARGGSRR